MAKKKRRKRNREYQDNGSSSTPKRRCFYLVQGEEVLEKGTKRRVKDLESQYKQLGMPVTVVDEQEYGNWKRRCIRKKQDEEYEEAKARDAEKQAEKERFEKIHRAFADPVKRRQIIANSYEKLFREKKYI